MKKLLVGIMAVSALLCAINANAYEAIVVNNSQGYHHDGDWHHRQWVREQQHRRWLEEHRYHHHQQY